MNTQGIVIYAVVCLADRHRYIGSTSRIEKRALEHWRDLAKGTHFSKSLQVAYNRHGREMFAFFILERIKDEDQVREREEFYIADAIRGGEAYNVSPVGGSRRGYKLSEETRRKQSLAKTGKRRPGFGAKIAAKISKVYRFLSPEGVLVETFGLRDFCLRHGLSMGNMSRLARGYLKQCKGWTAAPTLS